MFDILSSFLEKPSNIISIKGLKKILIVTFCAYNTQMTQGGGEDLLLSLLFGKEIET